MLAVLDQRLGLNKEYLRLSLLLFSTLRLHLLLIDELGGSVELLRKFVALALKLSNDALQALSILRLPLQLILKQILLTFRLIHLIRRLLFDLGQVGFVLLAQLGDAGALLLSQGRLQRLHLLLVLLMQLLNGLVKVANIFKLLFVLRLQIDLEFLQLVELSLSGSQGRVGLVARLHCLFHVDFDLVPLLLDELYLIA